MALSLGLLAACFSEQPRPAPPLISITLGKATVRSPDTLSGTLAASDPDGIDSMWMTMAAVPIGGWDGGLATQFTTSFRVLIGPGISGGDRLPIHIKARDLAGFGAMLDTAVTVSP